MEIKFKKFSENASLPVKAHESDAGLDLTVTNITTELNECGQLLLVYHTSLAMELPTGYVGLLFPRSSISKKSLTLTNSVGVIDCDYRGEITAKMKATTDVVPAIYKIGDKFLQLVVMPIPEVTVIESEELSKTDRGEGGYGSSDKDNSAATSVDSSEPQSVTQESAGQPADNQSIVEPAADFGEVTKQVVDENQTESEIAK